MRCAALGQKLDLTDEHQVVQRPGVGDDDAHFASNAEPVQVLPVALELGRGHGFVEAARLEKAVQRGAGREAEQAAQLGSRQPAGAVLLRCERLQRPARKVVVGAEPAGQVVGDGKRDVHRGNLVWQDAAGNDPRDPWPGRRSDRAGLYPRAISVCAKSSPVNSSVARLAFAQA